MTLGHVRTPVGTPSAQVVAATVNPNGLALHAAQSHDAHAVAAHNPQGPGMAQGRRIQHQLQMQVQIRKDAALKDADAWYADVCLHDPKYSFIPEIREDYLTALSEIKACIRAGNTTLKLTSLQVTHFSAAVLQHFDSFDFAFMVSLSSIKIPAPARPAPAEKPRVIRLFSCHELTEFAVADTQNSAVDIAVVDYSKPGSRYASAQGKFAISAIDCVLLKRIDLSQTAATEARLHGSPMAVCLAEPPRLASLQGAIAADFDPKGDLFIRMLNNRALELVAIGAAPGANNIEAEAERSRLFAGLVKLGQVALLMFADKEAISDAAQSSSIPAPCLQQSLLDELFAPVLQQYLGPALWPRGEGVVTGKIPPVEIPNSLKEMLISKAKAINHREMLQHLVEWFPISQALETLPSLPSSPAKPGSLVEICIQSRLAKLDMSNKNGVQSEGVERGVSDCTVQHACVAEHMHGDLILPLKNVSVSSKNKSSSSSYRSGSGTKGR
jgi:hypothetical protein